MTRTFAAIEIYPDEATAVAALQAGATPDRLPLPEWAISMGVVEVGAVTVLRPDDVAIRREHDRPGLLYRDLVRHHGRDRLVLSLAGLRPFGHPFHDDIFSILGELGRVGGRLGLCGVPDWYRERLPLFSRHFRVMVAAGVGDLGAVTRPKT